MHFNNIFTTCSHSKTMMTNHNNNNMIKNISNINFSSLSASAMAAGDSGQLFHHVQAFEIMLAIFVFVAIHALRQKRKQGLPVWPVVGMLPSLASALHANNVYDWLTDVLRSQNGTFCFKGPWLSSLNCVLTADPRNVEHLLKTKFPNFPKGPFFRDTVRDLLGDGIFSADDDTWQRQRKTASIEFHSARFRTLTTETLVELVHDRLLPVLEDSIKHLVPIDLQDVLLRLTFDNVCMMAFGVDPGCLRKGLPRIAFARAFEDATEVTLLRFVTPTCVWKAMRYFNIGMERNLRNSIREVDEFADKVIRTRKRELSSAFFGGGGNNDDNGESTKKRSDLLTVFMGLKDEKGERFSDKFLRDICVNFILAGRDTSSVALSWFFWLLDQNREIEEKILEELCRIMGERDEVKKDEEVVSENGLVFRAKEIKKMDYLQAAISEALRLYPSVPVDHKEVVEDDKFPDGTELKRGTKVIYAIYTMGRMEAIWGKDCREYKPERWLRDGQYMSESAYKFTAFNGGPRLCLGKDFAYYQMKFVAASIIYRYHVKVAKNHPVVPKMALTMYMRHGLKVNLFRREESELQKYFKS